jgi:hypothetical protein
MLDLPYSRRVSITHMTSTRSDEHRGMLATCPAGRRLPVSFVYCVNLVRQAWRGVATALRQAAPTIQRDIEALESVSALM